MTVKIRFFGALRLDRDKEKIRSVPPGASVLDVIEELRLPRHLLGIVLINDRHAQIDDLLHDGDTVCLLPPLGGG